MFLLFCGKQHKSRNLVAAVGFQPVYTSIHYGCIYITMPY